MQRQEETLKSCQGYLILRKICSSSPQYFFLSPTSIHSPLLLLTSHFPFPFSNLIWIQDRGITYILSILGDKGTTGLWASKGQTGKNRWQGQPIHLWKRSRNSSDLFQTAAQWALHPELFGHKSCLYIKQKSLNHLNTSIQNINSTPSVNAFIAHKSHQEKVLWFILKPPCRFAIWIF